MNAQHSTVRCITIYTRTNNSSKGRFGMHEYTSGGSYGLVFNFGRTEVEKLMYTIIIIIICLISYILVLLWTILCCMNVVFWVLSLD